MDPLKIVYDIAINTLGPPAALIMSLKGRFGGRWAGRLGWTSLGRLPAPVAGRPRLLFHAASVGEAKSAVVLIRALLNLAEQRGFSPEVYLSVGTPAGLEEAKRLLSAERRVWPMAAPVDFWGAPARLIGALKPQAVIIIETELWPNFIESAAKSGAKLVLAAARLSDRSFSRYRKIGGFMAKLLRRFDWIAAMGETERDLYAALGAPKDRLTVSGNPKFDHLLADVESPAFQEKNREWAEKIKGPGPLIVAGSTHPGEEEIIVRAYEGILSRYPAARLLLAPRHLGRVGEILALLRGRHLSATLTSEAGAPAQSGPGVFLADSLGQLLHFYALAEVALVGGSLLPGLSGHNPLEAAATRTPILFGPHMKSFAGEARALLKTGGAKEILPETLAADLEFWLKEREAAQAAAQAAHQYLAGRGAAAAALAEIIINLITPQ